MHFDSTALALKKEHLYRLIGREYVNAGCPGELTPKLQKWVDEINTIDKTMEGLKNKMTAKQTKQTKQTKKRSGKGTKESS